MKAPFARVVPTTVTGLLIIAPVYLTILLLLKALGSLKSILVPITAMLPAGLQHESLLAVLVLLACGLLVGLAWRTEAGHRLGDTLERTVYAKIPGYKMLRSLTHRIAGDEQQATWLPALVDTDDGGLMPVFVVEELADGRYTVFVPSVPTPLAGSVFIYARERVHVVNVPFRQAIGVVSRWGEGAKDLVAAMK